MTAPSVPPRKTRVTILGGGIAALATAFELTATQALRDQYEVTVYQMGWRLGGKLASSTNPGQHGRNEEHGLHVWFGFYENAFGALRRCYAELQSIQPQFRFPSPDEAFQPRDFTPVGYRSGSGLSYWKWRWPQRPGVPGDGQAPDAFIQLLVRFYEFIKTHIIEGLKQHDAHQEPVSTRLSDDLEERLRHLSSRFPHITRIFHDSETEVEHLLDKAHAWLKALEASASHFVEADFKGVAELLERFKNTALTALRARGVCDPDEHPFLSALDLGLAIIVGVLNPRYGIMKDFNLNRIDEYDLRAWLVENGADRDIADRSSLVRALYDIPFQYEDGRIERPNFAAGAALRWAFRTGLTYKGHALYLPQAGFGEVVIAPYYQVLRERGVHFKFFHKVQRIELSEDGNQVGRIHLERQADLAAPEYEATRWDGQLYRWPHEPFWDQLKDGETLCQNHVDFESPWSPWPAAGNLVLEHGSDFDHVVLGIALGAFKRLNPQDTPLAQELIEASGSFRQMTEKLLLVATAGVQLWLEQPVTKLGWSEPPATVGGPEPLDVWVDMSQVLQTEGWQPGTAAPASLHYLCGPIPTTLYDRPAGDATVPEQAQQQVAAMTRQWLEKSGADNWKAAGNQDAQWDWNLLFDSAGATGPERLDAQFLRANISPTECCVTSFAGTTRYRLSADKSGFTNLYLAGAWTDTGINVTCVEGATISGMKASRAICGSPVHIAAENYLAGPFPPLLAAAKANAAPTAVYQERCGMGDESILPPGLFQGTRAYLLAVKADAQAMQAQAERYLSVPTGGAFSVRVICPLLFFNFLNVERLSSPRQVMGFTDDLEFSISYPVVLTGPQGSQIAFWMPYVIINNTRGMVTGRESWGYFKSLGKVLVPRTSPADGPMRVETMMFSKFDPNTRGEVGTLIDVEGAGDPSKWAALRSTFSQGSHFCQELHDLLARSATDLALFLQLTGMWLRHELPVVNLKQIRDVADGTKACYQALTISPLKMSNLTAGGILSEDLFIRVTDCASHEIIRQFGLASGRVPVEFGMWVDLDFSAEEGWELWNSHAAARS